MELACRALFLSEPALGTTQNIFRFYGTFRPQPPTVIHQLSTTHHQPSYDQPHLIHNAQVFTPNGDWQPGWLLAEDWQDLRHGTWATARFRSRAHHPPHRRGRAPLAAGLIDLHVHGAMGHEAMDASPDGLREMARDYASHGVTGFLATTWTASGERILAAIQAVAQILSERSRVARPCSACTWKAPTSTRRSAAHRIRG